MNIESEFLTTMDSNLLKFIKDSPQIIDKETFEKSAKEAGIPIIFLDDGGSRFIYEVVGQDLVLKVARWSGGRFQNKNEAHPAFRKFKTLFNVPLAWNDYNSVALYTKLKPFDEKSFDTTLPLVFGIRGQDLCNLCYTIQDEPEKAQYIHLLDKMTEEGRQIFNILLSIHHTGVPELCIKELPADYLKPCSYGLALDGSLKIIDFGLTQEYFTLPFEK